MADHTLTVGKVTITAVKDLPAMRGDPGFMFPQVGAGDWAGHLHWLNDRGHLEANVGTFLVRSDSKTILIDTGIGRKPRPGFRTERAGLPDNLAALGVQPADVDLVVLTHLHVDHVGWNTIPQGEGWAPTFPRARYLIQQGEWDYFLAPERRELHPYIMDSVAPLEAAGQVDLTGHERAITADLTYLPTPGHTPDHMSILVQSQGERALIIGDVAHHPVQLTETEWEIVMDLDPRRGVESRKMVVERAERENLPLLGGHFPFPGMGRLVRLNERRVWQALDVP